MKNTICYIIIPGLLFGSVTQVSATDKVIPATEVIQEANQVVASGPAVEIDRIEIWIANEIITTKDITAPMRQYREHLSLKHRGPELEAKLKETRELHIERMIEGKLLLLEAREQEYDLSDTIVDEQVDKEIENMRSQFPSRQAFKAELAKEHLNETDFRKERKQMVHENLLRQRLLQTKIQEFKTGVEVTDTQLQEYYKQAVEKFTQPSRAHLSQIFVARPDVNLPGNVFKQKYQAARTKIRQARNALQAGTPFTEVARQYSEHKITAEKGGDIGWVEEGNIGMPEFEKVAFKTLAVGKYSEVVETVRGFFIIQLLDKQPGGQLPFEEVRGRIRKEMMAESSDKRYKAWLETLKKKFKVRHAKAKS
ncbi:peptidylprolyl isomerase [bacterium]|nr:peptidylprolyl isomerase [bacterium]